MTEFLKAAHPEHGTIWAAIDEKAHHVEGRVRERRASAFLSPFASEEAASKALLEAGGSGISRFDSKRARR